MLKVIIFIVKYFLSIDNYYIIVHDKMKTTLELHLKVLLF